MKPTTTPIWSYWIPVIATGIALVANIGVAAFNYWLFRKQEKLKREYDRSAYDYQIKLAKLHEKYSEVIPELRKRLRTIWEEFRFNSRLGMASNEQMNELRYCMSQFSDFHKDNELYLPEQLNVKLKQFRNLVYDGIINCQMANLTSMSGSERTRLQKSMEEVRSLLEAILAEVDHDFRSLIGITEVESQIPNH
jgi:glutathionyl-hydroquinone reductase